MNNLLNNKKLIFFLIFIFVIFFFLIVKQGWLSKNLNKSAFDQRATVQDQTKLIKEESTVTNKTGRFDLSFDQEKNKFAVDEEIGIILTVDSDGKIITAYDALINYQKEAFNLVSSESLISDFDFFKFEKNNFLAITSVKKINSQTETVFANKKTLSLKFKPKKRGRFDFIIVSSNGKEKTQFVDKNSKIYYPQTNKITVEIY